jgi:hypothetical protein
VVLGLKVGNFGVYVFDERGEPHHLPHAHIKLRGQRIASVFLLTLTVYDNRQRLPHHLLREISTEQPALLQLWAELNEDDGD